MADQKLHFIGVTTGSSRIMELFPVWADVLGLDASIEGRDLEIGADPQEYRDVVTEIRDRSEVRGALVTTHKVQVIKHAGDVFEELDRFAELLGEVSCISKRPDDDAVVGHAKDPITAGQALDAMIGPSYWGENPSAEVLLMGAGGAGAAISLRLLTQSDPPARIVLTDVDAGRLEEVRAIHDDLGRNGVEVDYVAVDDAERHAELLGGLAPGSLVVNATGMGKDTPGSPLPDHAVFPPDAVVWELNYRGPRPFLGQARAQERERHLSVHDGWRYFLHGWSEVIAEVFHLELTSARFGELADAAERFRPD